MLLYTSTPLHFRKKCCTVFVCYPSCTASKKRSLPSQWSSCWHRRGPICAQCPSLSLSGHLWSGPGLQNRCPSHSPRTERESKGSVLEQVRHLKRLFPTARSVCVCSTTCLSVCLSAIYLFIFLSALPANCEGTSPCLCGLVTFWHLPSRSLLHPTKRFPDPAEAPESPLSHCCDNSHRPPTGLTDTHTHVQPIYTHRAGVCARELPVHNSREYCWCNPRSPCKWLHLHSWRTPAADSHQGGIPHHLVHTHTQIHTEDHWYTSVLGSMEKPHSRECVHFLHLLPLHHGLKSRWNFILSVFSKMCPSGDLNNTTRWYWPMMASAGLCRVSSISSCAACCLNHQLSLAPRSFWTLITTWSLLPEETYTNVYEMRFLLREFIFLLFMWDSNTK